MAGAVLYGETVASEGTPQLPFWIQNARVLDDDNRMAVEIFPPEAIEGSRHTISTRGPRRRANLQPLDQCGRILP